MQVEYQPFLTMKNQQNNIKYGVNTKPTTTTFIMLYDMSLERSLPQNPQNDSLTEDLEEINILLKEINGI